MTKERKIFQHVTSSNICLVYELLRQDRIISFPLTDDAERRVEALAASISGGYFGKEIYQTAEEKAVAYLYFLIKDHPFTDGNKRTASLVFLIACSFNDLQPHFADFTLDELAVFVEKIQEQDHHQVIKIIAQLLFN